MSGGLDVLQLKEEDVVKFLAASTHLGANNVNFQMEPYIYKRKPDGGFIINLRRTWEKLLMAARIIVGIENPADVCVISSRPYGQRAVLKFAAHTGATAVAGRFTPGTFTNQIQSAFREPRLLVVTDPHTDHQAVTEASYVNIPVIAFCNTDCHLRNIDLVIPCNNKGINSTGLMWWMLAREVLRMRGTISRTQPWDIMCDLYFYRDPDEEERQEQQMALASRQAEEQPAFSTEWGSTQVTGDMGDWNIPTIPAADQEWGGEAPAAAAAPPAAQTFTEDWGAETKDWSAETKEWGAETTTDWGAEPAPAAATTGATSWGASITQDQVGTGGTGGDWA